MLIAAHSTATRRIESIKGIGQHDLKSAGGVYINRERRVKDGAAAHQRILSSSVQI